MATKICYKLIQNGRTKFVSAFIMNKQEFEFTDSSIGSEEIEPNRTASNFEAYFNIVCAVAGAGILGLPYAMRDGGWVAIIFFFVGAVLSTYTSKQLIECLYYKPGSRLHDLSDVGEAAFGKFGRYFIKFFHYSISLSFATIFIVLIGHNFNIVINSIAQFQVMNEVIWTIIAGCIILIPFALLKTMKEVAILALFGVLCTLFVVGVVLVVGGMEFNSPSFIQPSQSMFKWEGIPLALSTIAYGYGGNVVYPHIEVTMRNPRSWNKVMIWATISITIMFVSMGVAGYLFYGDLVQSPVLDSLKPGLGANLAYILITLHTIMAAPIYLCSFALEQERFLGISIEKLGQTKELIYRIIFRTSIAVVLTLIAIFVPLFGDLVALVGAVSNCIIVFLFPVVCHYKLLGWRHRPIYDHTLSLLVVIIGLIGLIFGSFSAFTNLIIHLREKSINY